MCSLLRYHGDADLESFPIKATASMAFVALSNADGVGVYPLSSTCAVENQAKREASEIRTKIHLKA